MDPPRPSPSPQRQVPPPLTPREDRPQLPPHSFVTTADSAAAAAAAAAEASPSPDTAAQLMDEAVLHGFLQLLPGAEAAAASVPETVRPAQRQVEAQVLLPAMLASCPHVVRSRRCMEPKCQVERSVHSSTAHIPCTLCIPIASALNAILHTAHFALPRQRIVLPVLPGSAAVCRPQARAAGGSGSDGDQTVGLLLLAPGASGAQAAPVDEETTVELRSLLISSRCAGPIHCLPAFAPRCPLAPTCTPLRTVGVHSAESACLTPIHQRIPEGCREALL